MKFFDKLTAGLIILIVATIVATSASLIVRKAFTDKDANFKIAETLLNDYKKHNQEQALAKQERVLAETNEKLTSATVSAERNFEQRKAACQQSLSTAENITSIKDLLLSMNLPTDLAYRTSLAERYNIKEYKGTTEQNRKLIKSINEDNLERCVQQDTNSPTGKNN